MSSANLKLTGGGENLVSQQLCRTNFVNLHLKSRIAVAYFQTIRFMCSSASISPALSPTFTQFIVFPQVINFKQCPFECFSLSMVIYFIQR